MSSLVTHARPHSRPARHNPSSDGAAGGKFLDGRPHLNARLRIQPRRRLVKEQNRRIADEAHRDVKTPLHPARIRGDPACSSVGEAEAREQGDSVLADD